MTETVTLTIDGQTVETTKGTSVLAAALEAGICIPNLCYLPGTPATGACRVCVVELEQHGRTRMTASCTLEAKEGMVIHAHSENVLRARRNIVELLLAEAPESAVLQTLAERLEVDEVRYREREEDCVLCGRCVAACAVVAGRARDRALGRPESPAAGLRRVGCCDRRSHGPDRGLRSRPAVGRKVVSRGLVVPVPGRQPFRLLRLAAPR